MNEPLDKTVPQLFEEQTRRTPERIALEMQGIRFTFRQVNERANQVAHALKARGVGRDVHVGVHLHRSPDAVCAILGIWKAGGAYVPVDPTYPEARRRFILEDSNAALTITEQGDPGLGVPVLEMKNASLDDNDRTFTCSPADPNDKMYLLYTSGSTGRPKGVCGIHQATMNRFAWMWQEFPFEDGEVSGHMTKLSFLDSLWEMFGPLLRGVKVLIVSNDDGSNPHRSITLLHDGHVTRITMVPSLLNAFLLVRPDLGDALPLLKTWISSGERLPARLLKKFLRAAPHATLLNLYGSTEVAGDVTCAIFKAGESTPTDPLSIGKPIYNAQTYILDENVRPLPVGEVGELFIGGPVLARGYHCRPDDEKKRFIPSPFNPGERLFRTGDRVRSDADGTLYYVGRMDNQVKIRGFRIELEEVEAILQGYPGPIGQVGAVVHQDGDDIAHRRLVVFVTPKDIDTQALGRFAASRLPAYMVPSRILAVDELPLTSTGKLDRGRLQQMRTGRTADVPTDLLPRTPTECLLAELWANRLGVWPISRTDSFQLLGGDSLSLVAFFAELRSKLPEIGFFDASVGTAALESLALWVDERRAGRESLTTKPPPQPFEVVPFDRRHFDEAVELATVSFLTREPMMIALAPRQEDFSALAKRFAEHCLSSGLSFVAVSGVDERIVGFCFCHDYAVRTQSAAEAPPVGAEAFLLMGQLANDYCSKIGTVPEGEIVKFSMTGATADVDGFGVALVLERRSLEFAERKGFKRATSLCTNRVTAQIAVELGFERVAAIQYGSFEVDGKTPFAGSPAQFHGEAVLFEKWL